MIENKSSTIDSNITNHGDILVEVVQVNKDERK